MKTRAEHKLDLIVHLERVGRLTKYLLENKNVTSMLPGKKNKTVIQALYNELELLPKDEEQQSAFEIVKTAMEAERS